MEHCAVKQEGRLVEVIPLLPCNKLMGLMFGIRSDEEERSRADQIVVLKIVLIKIVLRELLLRELKLLELNTKELLIIVDIR